MKTRRKLTIIIVIIRTNSKEKRLISLVIGGGVTLNTLRDVLAASPFSSDHEVKKCM
jgi:hypothetical protein